MTDDVIVVGMSHRTSPVELRERLAVSGPGLVQRLDDLAGTCQVREALLLSTCNRVEVYLTDDDPAGAARRVRSWLEAQAGEPVGSFLYERRGADAIRHAFRVASSLDSMVVGEPQILGQVKEAVAASKARGGLGGMLERCFHRAFAVAKEVRSQTGIAAGSVSVSSVAAELAAKIFGDLTARRVLLVGAGEMGEAAAKHLRRYGADLYVLNRNKDKAHRLAEANDGHARGWDELEEELVLADVVVSSTSARLFVIRADMMRQVARRRRHRPLFLIDIAVPRDVDPRVGAMDNVFLYDVDDLQKVAAENLDVRRREAERAERFVDREVLAFEHWRRSDGVKPVVVGLRSHVRGVLQGELERTLPRLKSLSAKERASLDRMVNAMVNKLLHHPVSALKADAGAGGAELVDAARRLFPLDEEEADEPPAAPKRPRGAVDAPDAVTAVRARSKA
ncbi:MAG: glutamyl-tRNA reductase [Sandaracinaceae bacterium]